MNQKADSNLIQISCQYVLKMQIIEDKKTSVKSRFSLPLENETKQKKPSTLFFGR